MAEIEIHAVTFGDQGLQIQFMELPTDVRVQGRVVRTSSLQLHASHPDYADDIDLLHRQVVKVLKNALEDFHDSEPWSPEVEDEDDGDLGMGER